jgi:hypothetical protein
MTKTKGASRSGAHRKHRGALSEGGDGPERLDHGEAVMAALCSAVRMTMALGQHLWLEPTLVGQVEA